ncbi:hypothetical protein CIP100161_00103 [Corynebacterium diphtheriae]|nr:hypothetical protein CIP100161_00103 [Corynebacterium diphtheriae]
MEKLLIFQHGENDAAPTPSQANHRGIVAFSSRTFSFVVLPRIDDPDGLVTGAIPA